MTHNRIIVLIFVISVLIVSHVFDFSNEWVNFFMATGLLALEVVGFIKYRRQLNSSSIFQVWSTEWIGRIGVTLVLIYSFADETMNYWNICAIAEIVTFGGLYVVRNRLLTYRIEETGIRNLFNQRLLDSSTITSIKFDDHAVVIDTTKYRNELVIKADVLHSPTWDELTRELSKLNRMSTGK